MDIEDWKKKRSDYGLKEKQESEVLYKKNESNRESFDYFLGLNNLQKIKIDLSDNYDFVFENICEWLVNAKKGSKTEKFLKSFYESLIRCFSYCKNLETSNAQAYVYLLEVRNELYSLKSESEQEIKRNDFHEVTLNKRVKELKLELDYIKKN